MTQGARDVRYSSVRMHMQYKALLQCMTTIGPNIFYGRKCQISRRFFGKMPDFTEFFWLLFFEPPTPLTCTKAYLRYLMSLAVILLLIAMLTAGPDRLYRVARSHVQL